MMFTYLYKNILNIQKQDIKNMYLQKHLRIKACASSCVCESDENIVVSK